MADNTLKTGTKSKGTGKTRSRWNYLPPSVPISQAPYCEWPIRPVECLKYLIKSWMPMNPRIYYFLTAVVIWTWFTPSLERTITFQLDWMFEIWLRNFILMLIVAGGLHLWFYTIKGQGEDTRYDARPFVKKNKVFHFSDQVWDNMFWTLSSSVLVATLFESFMLWAYANGYATFITFYDNPAWFIALVIMVPFWSGFYFYWYHRLFHVEPLYRWFHRWHHKNINTGPWSGHAMHPVEHIALYADSLIYLLLASHPIHMQFGLMMHTLDGPISHCGYDKLKLGGARVQLGDFLHQLHHRFFDCNYGTYETPWDKVFGSFHDGTPEGDRRIQERRRRLSLQTNSAK